MSQGVALKIKSHSKIGSKVKKVILGFISFVIVLVLGCTIFYWIKSPGKLRQYVDAEGKVLEGSLCQREYAKINGTKIGMIIKSKDISNPVLLFLHGGSGMPEYPMTWDFPSKIEDYFTVVWMEQRGAGLSYNGQMKLEDITTEQYIDDIIEMSKYLCQRFNTKQIYLMAHSAGTFAGIQAASRAPELYKAYIGMGQIKDQQASKELAYEYMVDYFDKIGDKKAVSKLKKYHGTKKYDRICNGYMCKAGIETTRLAKSEATGIFLPSMNSPEYTLGEKINLWRGLIFCKQSKLEEDCQHVDLGQRITKLEMPVYFLSGAYDYITNNHLAEAFLEQIEAPVKGFYRFDQSAHSPIFEEPDEVVKVLNEDVKRGTNRLATSK